MWTCSPPPSLPPFTLKTRPVSSHQGRGAFSMSTWGQVVFRSHSCPGLRLLLTCSDRQILLCCLRTNGPIHVEAPTDIVSLGGGGIQYQCLGRLWGVGVWIWQPLRRPYNVAQHSQPLTCSPCFHRNVTGDTHEWVSQGHSGPSPGVRG